MSGPYHWAKDIGNGAPGWVGIDGSTIPHDPNVIVTPQGWVPAWADEFTGATLDMSKWNYTTGGLGTDQSYNRAENVAIVNNQLVITAKNEAFGGRAYTSGYINTQGGKLVIPATNWRHEMRAKVPLQPGMWAAPVWFRANDGSAGEIDTVETYGGTLNGVFQGQWANQTLHTDYSADVMAHARVPWSSLRNPDPLAFHTYITEKTPGSIKIWVDEVMREFTPATYSQFTAYYDVGKQWNIRCCLQVGPGAGGGGAAAGDPSTAATDWNQTQMVIDYMRLYTKG